MPLLPDPSLRFRRTSNSTPVSSKAAFSGDVASTPAETRHHDGPRRPRPTHRGCSDPPLFPSVTMGSRRRFHHRREDARIPSLLPMVAHSRRLSHTIPVRLSPSRSSASRQPKIARWHTIGPPLNAGRVSLQPLSHLAQSVETGRAVLAAKGTPLSILGRSLFLGHPLANGFPATARTGAFSHARLSACSGKVGSRCA